MSVTNYVRDCRTDDPFVRRTDCVGRFYADKLLTAETLGHVVCCSGW